MLRLDEMSFQLISLEINYMKITRAKICFSSFQFLHYLVQFLVRSTMNQCSFYSFSQGFIQDFTSGGTSKSQGVPLLPLPSLSSLPLPFPPLP